MNRITVTTVFVIFSCMFAWAQEPPAQRILPMSEFVQLATQNDTQFEEILIDELALHYSKDLKLPARDIILDIKSQYNFYLNQNREDPDLSISLTKLFPYTGTDVSVEYNSSPSLTTDRNSSDVTFMISQPIAENAFGKSTRLLSKIIGLEVDVARHQIVEAYEDYLATVMTAYISWYEAYENLKIGESSYNENLKLMDNIKQRQKSSIALPVDVNKINLQVLAKKENLIDLTEKYQTALNFVKKAIRYNEDQALIPAQPDMYQELNISFDEKYAIFEKESRTYQTLHMLEEKSSLEVDKNANELLPSINLLAGYTLDGDNMQIKNEEALFFAGVSIEWPFSDQTKRAQYETSKVTEDKTRLSTVNTHYKLYTDIRNLFLGIEREGKLTAIAQEKIGLSRSVLEDETENYSFGKVTINDYIDAVNALDTQRFNHIRHDAQYRKLAVEWMRITDKLISKKEIPALDP